MKSVCAICGAKDKLYGIEEKFLCEKHLYEFELIFNDANKLIEFIVSTKSKQETTAIYEEINKEFELHTPSQLKKMLDTKVIGQDHAKKALVTEVYKHYLKLTKGNGQSFKKSNLLITGETGTGKTFLLQTLAKILNVPFYIADATTLTESGYVGDDVENILLGLIRNADYDISKAEKGIIYIDEIDKIAKKGGNVSITRDVSGEGVQQALLKIVEGTVASVPSQGGRKHPQGKNILIDTSNILFVAGGAFVGVEEIVKKRMNTNAQSIGFNSNKQERIDTILRKDIEHEDLKQFGLIPEFLGRFPKISNLESLTTDMLVEILKSSSGNIIESYQNIFKLENKELNFTDEAYKSIAEKALNLKLGARGLEKVIEDVLLDTMFDMPDEEESVYTVTKKLSITKKMAKRVA